MKYAKFLKLFCSSSIYLKFIFVRLKLRHLRDVCLSFCAHFFKVFLFYAWLIKAILLVCLSISTTFCGMWRLKERDICLFSLILAPPLLAASNQRSRVLQAEEAANWEGGDLARPRHRKRKALIVSKKVLKRAKKVLDFDSLCEALPSTASKRPHSLARPLLHWCGEAPKAVEIEAVSRGSFKSSWSLMRLKRRPRAWGREGPASARLLKRP